jgi:hypothetical protein
MRLRHAFLNRLAAALVALALAVLGFGHAHAPGSSRDPLVSAWLQSGGSVEDLCRTESGRSHHGKHDDCPACALAKCVALSAPGSIPGPEMRLVAHHPARSAAHLTDGHAPRAPPGRGPPADLV